MHKPPYRVVEVERRDGLWHPVSIVHFLGVSEFGHYYAAFFAGMVTIGSIPGSTWAVSDESGRLISAEEGGILGGRKWFKK